MTAHRRRSRTAHNEPTGDPDHNTSGFPLITPINLDTIQDRKRYDTFDHWCEQQENEWTKWLTTVDNDSTLEV